MEKDYTHLNHLYIRLPEYGDVDLLKIHAKDYYDHQMMSKKAYDFWLNRDYNEYFKSIKDATKGKEKGSMAGVQCYLYYLIEDDYIVGTGSLRLNPENNPELNLYGGHIGYGTIPSKRNKGYGTIFLHLLLKKAFDFGLKEVIVTCAENNLGSAKIIENNFGIFKDQVFDEKHNTNLKRYVIDVEKSIAEFEKRYLKKEVKHI